MTEDKDQFTLWIISGVIGVVIRDIYSFLAKLIGFADFFIWNVGANIFAKPSEVKTTLGIILGLLNDFAIGGLIGVLIGILIDWKGRKNYYIKGLAGGLGAWLFFFGIFFHNMPKTTNQAPVDALSNISAFIGHAIFGIVTSWAYIKLSE